MKIYLLCVLAASICLVVYYFLIKSKGTRENNIVIEYGISIERQCDYINAADKSKKYNSPVTNELFQELSVSGTTTVNKEAFFVNDRIVEGSDYRVL